MKKLMSLVAAVLFAGAVFACDAPAFSAVYESITVDVHMNGSYVIVGREPITFRKNPYANSKSCAPDMNWATCYEYCFSYKGKTYFFNPC